MTEIPSRNAATEAMVNFMILQNLVVMVAKTSVDVYLVYG